jgi:hypothetical protein
MATREETMTKTKLTNNLFQALTMAAALAAALPLPETALAQQNLENSIAIIHGGIANMPNIIAGIFYILGAIMIGTGLMKLKMHSENPTQTPLGHGLGRIGAGAGAVALPALAAWLNNSLAIGQNSATSQALGVVQ